MKLEPRFSLMAQEHAIDGAACRQQIQDLIIEMRRKRDVLLAGGKLEISAEHYTIASPLDNMRELFEAAGIDVNDHNAMAKFVGRAEFGCWDEWCKASNMIMQDRKRFSIEEKRKNLQETINLMRRTRDLLLEKKEANTWPYGKITFIDKIQGLFRLLDINAQNSDATKAFVGQEFGEWKEWVEANRVICQANVKILYAQMIKGITDNNLNNFDVAELYGAMSMNKKAVYTGSLKEVAQEIGVDPEEFQLVYQHYALTRIKNIADPSDVEAIRKSEDVRLSSTNSSIKFIAGDAELDRDAIIKALSLPLVKRVDLALPHPSRP